MVVRVSKHKLTYGALNKGDQDEKYREDSLDNAAFKKRVSGLVGGIALLKAVGFVKRTRHELPS